MPAIARHGDTLTTGHPCDGTSTLAAPGQSKVRVEGLLVARLGDSTVVHNHLVEDVCVPHVETIKAGSSKVFVAGSAAARVGDAVDLGAITSGSSKVMCG